MTARQLEDLRDEMFARLSGLEDAVRQTVTDSLWQRIPTYIVEKAYNPSPPGGILSWPAVESNPVLIAYATVWSSTQGTPQASGTLQLGDWQTPMNPGLNVFRPMLILTQSDLRTLTVPVANNGPCSVLLSGWPMPSLVPSMRR